MIKTESGEKTEIGRRTGRDVKRETEIGWIKAIKYLTKMRGGKVKDMPRTQRGSQKQRYI